LKIKRKNQGLIFIISTLICSYLFWGTLCLSAIGKIDKNIYYSMYNELYFLGGVMPRIIGIIFTIYFDGRKGIKSISEKLTLRNTKFRYLLFAVLFTLATIVIPKLINNILYFIAVLFIGGGVNEEFGWRGFLLPRL
jgi:uncharacterized protein